MEKELFDIMKCAYEERKERRFNDVWELMDESHECEMCRDLEHICISHFNKLCLVFGD
jgi:hypothetical protein